MGHFTVEDESRLRGALGSLEQAVSLPVDALEHGSCPLASTKVKDAEKMAEGAGILLGYVVGKESW